MADSQRKSYNLFDKTATDTDKGYLNNQRLNLTTIENSSNVAISEYISVDTSAAYYTLSGILTSGQYNASLAFYDNQYNPIQGYRYQGLASIRAQVPENAAYLRFTIIKANIDEIMLLKGYYATAEIPPYEPYGWVHSLRKLTTATEAVESPLYSDGTPITSYTIKGNTVQNGTPTPSNPVNVQGVGERTANLFDKDNATIYQAYLTDTQWLPHEDSTSVKIPCSPNTIYTISVTTELPIFRIATSDNLNIQPQNTVDVVVRLANVTQYTFTTSSTAQVIIFQGSKAMVNTWLAELMVNTGSTAKPYEPYGQYKIPISTLQGSAYVYLNEPLYKIGDTADTINSDGTVTRRIGKVVLDGTENQWILYEVPATPPTLPYALYQFYTNNSLSLGGVQNSSCYSNIAPYGFTSRTRQDGDLGVYLVTSGNEVSFQMEAAKSSFPDVTAWTTYLSQNPVTVYYIKAAPTTEQITLPSIPTTEGANSITVDTTVQPSEFTATWTGWHNAEVKEKSENLFDGTVRNAIINDSTGEETSNNNWRCSDFIKVADTKVTLSWVSDNQYYQAKLGYYEAADTETFLSTEVIQGNRYSGTFTIPENCNYIKISYSVVVSGNPVTREDIMLNEGTTAKTYAPYWK